MVGLTTAIFCDRRIYEFKGKWANPNKIERDARGLAIPVYENIFYYVSSPMTLKADFKGGREELQQEIEITCFGEKPICEGDHIVLEDGTKLRVCQITLNYLTPNIAVRDLVKHRVFSQVITLR